MLGVLLGLMQPVVRPQIPCLMVTVSTKLIQVRGRTDEHAQQRKIRAKVAGERDSHDRACDADRASHGNEQQEFSKS